MLREAPDPDILPAFVARRAVLVDLFDARADLAVAFPDIALPERLRDAVRKRHVEYLAGRWCAREALRAAHPHLAGHPLPPGDDRAPVWPDDVVGSITHTQGFAAAAVADAGAARGLGIDSEERFTLDRARRLAGHYARPGELAALARATELDEAALATVVFSAKESLYKCLYPSVRRFFGFQSAELVGVAGGRFALRLTEGLTSELRAGDVFEGRYAITDAHVHTALVLAR